MDCQEIRNDDEMLIKLVEEISYIYDKKLNLFKDKMARAKAWQSIAKVLEKTPLECEQRWTILRHRYATEKRRMRDQSIKQSFWPLFNAMSFLNAFIMPRNLRSTWNMKRQDSINQEDSVGSMSPREIAQHFGDDDDYCGNAKLPIDGISVKTEATDYEVQATLANNRSCAEAHRDVTPNPNESSTPKIAKAEDKIPMLMERFDRNMGDCVERGLNESLDPDLAFGRTVALHLKEINDKKKRNAVKLQIMKALLEGDGEV